MALTPNRYIYQRRGGPLLSWAGGPPYQSRGADAKSLGGLGSLGNDTHMIQRPLLPRPGAPEYLDDPPMTLPVASASFSRASSVGEYVGTGEYVGVGEYVGTGMGEYVGVGMGHYDAIPSSSPPIGQRGLGGCGCGPKKKKGSCGGKCGHKHGMSGVADIPNIVTGAITAHPILSAVAAYFVYRHFAKKH